jgi:hypothetical protein
MLPLHFFFPADRVDRKNCRHQVCFGKPKSRSLCLPMDKMQPQFRSQSWFTCHAKALDSHGETQTRSKFAASKSSTSR